MNRTRDQFYFNIDRHYGSSDHTVFLSKSVPAVLFNNWPDIAYHTSEDRPFNADPTQLKRAAFIALSSLSVMADARGEGALSVAQLVEGNAAARTGEQLRLALQMAGSKEQLKEAFNIVQQAYLREAEAIRSAKVLAEEEAVSGKIETMARTFAESGLAADRQRLTAYVNAVGRGGELNTLSSMTPEEKTAAGLVPVRLRAATPPGPPQGQNGAQPADRATASRNQYNSNEMRAFADGKRSVLEIRNAVSAEYGPLDVTKVLEFFRNGEKSGEFELRPASK